MLFQQSNESRNVYVRVEQAEANSLAYKHPDFARTGGLIKAVEQTERRKLKKMKRHASLKRTPSQLEERNILKALERVPSKQPGTDAADTIATPGSEAEDNLSEPESDGASENALESKIGGMGLKERRAFWESTLPQRSSALPARLHSKQELADIADHTWIETDETPTVPYEEAGRTPAKPEKAAKSKNVRLPW